jgi:hypothetical protein
MTRADWVWAPRIALDPFYDPVCIGEVPNRQSSDLIWAPRYSGKAALSPYTEID